MANLKALKLVGLVLMVSMVVTGPLLVRAAITCGQVATDVDPCVSHPRAAGPLIVPCCNGLRALNAAVKTTPNRQQVCGRLKTIAASIPGINYGLCNSALTKCGINVSFKLSPTLDCTKIP